MFYQYFFNPFAISVTENTINIINIPTNENGGINNTRFNHLGILSTESIIVLYIAIFIIISVILINITQKIII